MTCFIPPPPPEILPFFSATVGVRSLTSLHMDSKELDLQLPAMAFAHMFNQSPVIGALVPRGSSPAPPTASPVPMIATLAMARETASLVAQLLTTGSWMPLRPGAFPCLATSKAMQLCGQCSQWCSNCTASNNCFSCGDRFHLGSNSSCLGCRFDCYTYGSSGSCMSCNSTTDFR